MHIACLFEDDNISAALSMLLMICMRLLQRTGVLDYSVTPLWLWNQSAACLSVRSVLNQSEVYLQLAVLFSDSIILKLMPSTMEDPPVVQGAVPVHSRTRYQSPGLMQLTGNQEMLCVCRHGGSSSAGPSSSQSSPRARTPDGSSPGSAVGPPDLTIPPDSDAQPDQGMPGLLQQ